MINKILFTALVIGIVIAVVQLRRKRSAKALSRPDQTSPDAREGWRWLAYFAVLLILVGSALFMFDRWRDATEVVELKVVDVTSGRSVLYQAYRSDIEERSFRTLDGRRIVLAQTERLESGE